jgi:hypothetical protein
VNNFRNLHAANFIKVARQWEKYSEQDDDYVEEQMC